MAPPLPAPRLTPFLTKDVAVDMCPVLLLVASNLMNGKALCLAPIYRRERRFFEICMPGERLRNSGSNVGPTSLLQMLIREMGKGEDGRY